MHERVGKNDRKEHLKSISMTKVKSSVSSTIVQRLKDDLYKKEKCSGDFCSFCEEEESEIMRYLYGLYVVYLFTVNIIELFELNFGFYSF